jgi:hypothetical protein
MKRPPIIFRNTTTSKAIEQYAERLRKSRRVITTLTALVGKMEETKKKLKDNLEVYSSVLKDFTTDIGYFDYLKDDENPDEDRIGNVNALFDDISHFINTHPESTFQEYLQNVTLLTSQDDMNAGNYVSLMTIHVAKGLEFDYVFVISMNEGAFPSMRAEMESGEMPPKRNAACLCRDDPGQEAALLLLQHRLFVCDGFARDPSRFFKEAGLTLPKSYAFTPVEGGSSWNNPSWNNTYNQRKGTGDYFADNDAFMKLRKPSLSKKNPPPTASPIGRLATRPITRSSAMASWWRSSTRTSSS